MTITEYIKNTDIANHNRYIQNCKSSYTISYKLHAILVNTNMQKKYLERQFTAVKLNI